MATAPMPTRVAAAAQDHAVPFGTTPLERATMSRALAWLFAAGGVLVIVTIVLPHNSNTTDAGIVGAGLIAFVVAAGLIGNDEHMSVRALQLVLALGVVLITACVVYGGDSAGAYPFMYLWVSLYAYYFFSLTIATVLIAWCAGMYGVAVLLFENQTPVPAVHWLMATGTIVVGGMLIGRLTAAIRAQAADLATVSQMSVGLSDVDDFAQPTCESLRASSDADVVIFMELLASGEGMQVSAMAGAPEAGLAFTPDEVREGLERALRDARPVDLVLAEPGRGLHRFDGTVVGLAQPVVRNAVAEAVIALAWTSPRRTVPERVRGAARLFAAEASLALDRADEVSQERERQALEINDNIVQGLVVAKYRAQRGDTAEAVRALDETLERARQLITDQLQTVAHGRGGGVRPGDLARSEASSVGGPAPAATDGP